MSQTGQQSIAIHILLNISRSKDNQIMTLGQLIEYNISKIFEKSDTKSVEKLFPDPFVKNWNWAYLWFNSLKLYTVCFYCMPSSISKYI